RPRRPGWRADRRDWSRAPGRRSCRRLWVVCFASDSTGSLLLRSIAQTRHRPAAARCDTAFCKAWPAVLSVFVERQTRRGKAFACHHVQHCDHLNANALPLPTLSARTAALWPTTVDRHTTPPTGVKSCVTSASPSPVEKPRGLWYATPDHETSGDKGTSYREPLAPT